MYPRKHTQHRHSSIAYTMPLRNEIQESLVWPRLCYSFLLFFRCKPHTKVLLHSSIHQSPAAFSIQLLAPIGQSTGNRMLPKLKFSILIKPHLFRCEFSSQRWWNMEATISGWCPSALKMTWRDF